MTLEVSGAPQRIPRDALGDPAADHPAVLQSVWTLVERPRPHRRHPTAHRPATGTRPGVDCVLRNSEEAAHARTVDRMNDLRAHGSGIDRYLN